MPLLACRRIKTGQKKLKMGDNSENYHSQNNGNYENHQRGGMEALMSAAIEQQNRNLQHAVASSGYSRMGSMQEQINALIAANPALEAEKDRLLAVAARQAMFPNMPTSAFPTTGQSHLNNLPFSFGLQPMPGLIPQTTMPGYHSIPNISTDKVPTIHESGPNGLNYPGIHALSPFMKLPGYPTMLPGASVPSLFPSIGSLNPAVLGAYSHYYNGLFARTPHIPHVDQNTLIRMHMNMGVNAPPAQPVAPEATSARTESPMRLENRPHLPVRDRVQRRVSAPISTGNPRFPIQSQNDPTMDLRKSVSPYSMNHRAQNDPKSQSRINNQIIGKRISDIISQNAKILDSPQLDRVKPRRPTRRNSLDACTLTPPLRKHPPLTATHSAPRSMDKYSNTSTTPDKQRFVPVQSQGKQPNPFNASKIVSTSIPDTRSAVDNRLNVAMVTSVDNLENSNLRHSSNIQNAIDESQSYEFQCPDCGSKFSKSDTLEAHREMYCLRRPKDHETRDSPNLRQSVIQHTRSNSGDTPPPHPHGVNTPAEHHKAPQIDETAKNPVPDALRNMHKDLHRTRSADAAFLARTLGNTTPSSALTKDRLTPTMPKSLSPRTGSPIQKSSIPTNKLPPKKKQLQLMRSNSSNPSSGEVSKSPTHDVTAIENAIVTQTMAPEQSSEFGNLKRKLQPPSSLPLESPSRKKVLPPWIPLGQGSRSAHPAMLGQSATHPLMVGSSVSQPPLLGSSPAHSSQLVSSPTQPVVLGSIGSHPDVSGSSSSHSAPVPFITQPSPTVPAPTFPSSPAKQKSPTSPVSPTVRSPARGSRSPSRSPTSNLESTIPRSNYRLLLHQISMRNMQDMGYLSEAYHHSKDKDLKRNIAALLCSSTINDGNGTSKSGKQFPWEVPNMEELYPGKAKLARRLSPNGDLRFRNQSTQKTPLGQSHSRPYESTLEVHPTVTRSHSAGTSSDVNNNIKQYLQNKSRNQKLMQQQNSAQGATKTHKPLIRTNANARYLLKSPTKDSALTSSDNNTKEPLEMRKSVGPTESSKFKVKESLKRAVSHSPESSQERQAKRQKLFPILSQVTTSPSVLPSSLVTATIPTSSPKKELPRIKSINPHTVQTPFLLHPHVSPNFGYEPHPTFCSLVSPQPTYVELKQSNVSMYSQWAVSEPILPKGMTVMDMFKSTRLMKPLSPYISYNSVFTEPREKLKVTESKDYEKFDQSKHSMGESTSNRTEPVETSLKTSENSSLQSWLFSRMVDSHLQTVGCCYTSCHNQIRNSDTNFTKHGPPKSSKNNMFPKLCPPKVFIQPPSPESANLDGSNRDSPRSSEMIALEFSDCDSDDDVIKRNCGHHNLSIETQNLKSHCDVTTQPIVSSANQQPSIDLTHDEEGDGTSKNSETVPIKEIISSKVPDEAASSISHRDDCKKEVKGHDKDEASYKKKIRERLAHSLKQQQSTDANISADPTLAVHPIGACSDDPAKICALCRMKTEDDMTQQKGNEDGGERDELKITESQRPSSPEAGDVPSTSSPRARTPTPRSKTPVPLTVTVPKRNRDRSGSKSGSHPLTPGILDKARGNGTTQHWVTTTELQSVTPSPKQAEFADDRSTVAANETENLTTSAPFDSTECSTANPPNRNPVSELHYRRTSDSSSPPIVTSHGSLAAVVSGVMRSAAMQSKKKTKSSKTEMSELLSHSRPLIPTSELNGSMNKPTDTEKNADSANLQENSLSSLAMLTSSVGPNPGLKRPRRDSTSSKAADSRTQSLQTDKKSDSDNCRKVEEFTDSNEEEDLNCDETKEDSTDVEGESCNPRPHKCTECKVAFRIAGHLAKHLRSKGHVIAMQKKTLNRLKQQKFSTSQEISTGGQSSNSMVTTDHSPESSPSEELLTQLGEAQVRALFEGNDEYAEINTGAEATVAELVPEASDDETDGQTGNSDPRPFKCIACRVAFRFQGHLDRHFRSNTHLLAVGHFERDMPSLNPAQSHDGETAELNCEAGFTAEQEGSRVKKDVLLHNNNSSDVGNDVTENPKPFICLKDLNCQSSNTDHRLDATSVNQVPGHSDWSKSTSSKVKKFNGSLHSSSVLDVPNTLNSTTLRPLTQPTPSYEVTPTLSEVPLPSTSPVPQIKQLNCSSPVAI